MKVLVAHPAQQHSYRLAAALKQNHFLFRYITTVYYKKHSLTSLTSRLLRGDFKKKAQSRRCEVLDDSEVIQFCEGEGLLKLLARNTGFLHAHYNHIKYNNADRFAKRVAHYAIVNHVDAVVTYDNTSPLLFDILQKKAPHILRICDTSAANPLYMKEIYEKDILLAPAFEDRLRRERMLVWDKTIQERTAKEISLTQHFLVPSEFVANSLAWSGVKDEQMHICPYGVDSQAFTPKSEYNTEPDSILECIYVGGVKELKGISYLLEAFRSLPEGKAHLTVVGQFDENDTDIQPYRDVVTFTGTVLHSAIPDLLHNADVFILPSLGEGLSLSVLEAAACGLPLIVSENAGVREWMTQGKEGFVIPIQSAEAIADRVMWFCENKKSLPVMGKAAAEFAGRFTWKRYSENIISIFNNLLN